MLAHRESAKSPLANTDGDVLFSFRHYPVAEATRLAKRNQRRTLPSMSFVRTISGGLFFVLLFALGQALGEEAKPNTPTAKKGTLIIEFSGLQNNKGKVLAGLYNEEKKFPKENLALRNLKEPPKNKTCTIKTMNLPYGDYAVAAMHDENESGNMDFNFIGLPTEIYGFSNDKRPGLLGPPGFKACKFKIDKPVVKIKIHLK